MYPLKKEKRLTPGLGGVESNTGVGVVDDPGVDPNQDLQAPEQDVNTPDESPIDAAVPPEVDQEAPPVEDPQGRVPEPDIPNAELQAQNDAAASEEEENLTDIIRELIVEKAEKEDIDLRYGLINICQRNELYFNNIQNIVLDPVARDYRTVNSVLDELVKQGVNIDIKTINVYRAYAESIIAALSVEVPATEFAPDDAENPDDLETVEAYTRIAQILEKQNHAALMLIKALTILYNQGVVFGHNTYKTDPSFGIISKPKTTEAVPKTTLDLHCAQCGTLLDSGMPPETQPQASSVQCPNCGYTGAPDSYARLQYEHEVTEWEDTPKGRSQFDIYGATYVKCPLYARRQEDVGYLILRKEDHIARYRTKYNNLDLDVGKIDSTSYERYGRLPLEYQGESPRFLSTARYAYFRPWYYSTLEDEDEVNLLNSKFPKGLKATIIGDEIVEYQSCDLDSEWTISFDPRANFIHAEPAGNCAIPIQDAENDLFNLGIQCIEYGIPETFVHPKTLNLQEYSKNPSAPGMLSPALPYGADKTLADGFYQNKPATLSSEYTTFEVALQNKGQFVTGAMASLFGGTAASGSKTADEYRQSRTQALQRTQIPWRTIKVFWASLMYKCVRSFADNMIDDEKFTDKKNGSFINIWIMKSQLTGKVGQVEPDLNEQLPHSWAQKRDFITKLIEMQIPEVSAVLMHPNNSELLKQYSAMPEMYIPGENDRNKQFSEFQRMCAGEQVQIDIDVDDHPIHMAVLKNILVSPVGLGLDPQVYAMNIEHYRQHQLAVQAKTIAAAGKTPAGEPPQSATDTTEG